MGVVSIASTRSQAEQAMEGYPIWPEDVPIVGTPAEVVRQLQRYTELGVDLFILAFVDEPGLGGLILKEGIDLIFCTLLKFAK
jgi:alkanesulfonate monooxygenase SsuD/methylene tetrahydromethanopterin reductase-like flavin-dependent oxidoreductase (luciferase family)